ncbi:class I SAM-dependent DNA methyltransferase [Mycobacterium antarcticum]|uniref:class I SAM-dependent DNA methyltransferase n=1 Tax=Mycolicibacterium sp. TUM20985 TaxID=3023370 RepID=UPI002572E5FF|nr:class I SAM-dependent methyltransferase [Mycolicibacterium sp. TUM20985]
MTHAVVRRRYTEVSDAYTRMFCAVTHVHPDDLRFLERHFGRCAGTILDAGCGPGHLTGYLTDLGLKTIGIDLVPAFIESARANWPEVEFSVGSMCSLDLPDGSLGGILAWYSLIHCEPGIVGDVLRTFHTALSDNGTLVVGFFEGEDVEPFEHKVTTAYRWPVDEMSATLSAAGFVVVDRLRRPGTDEVRPHAALALRAR